MHILPGRCPILAIDIEGAQWKLREALLTHSLRRKHKFSMVMFNSWLVPEPQTYPRYGSEVSRIQAGE